MHIVRYAHRVTPQPQVGVLDGTEIRPLGVQGLAGLLSRPAAEIRTLVEGGQGKAVPAAAAMLLPPIDGRMEVWAAGVTYARSREARMEESATADVYSLVYDAVRPELFFKAVPWRVVTGGEPIAIRRDSPLNVAEAELAIVVSSAAEIVGYAVCNDVSSRTIEGENPLYLPQAKVYAGSCALSPGIRPAWEVADPDHLDIVVEVERAGSLVWAGQTNTDQIRRPPAELIGHLFEEEQYPDGVILSTGTGIVPELDFTLAAGDVVTITIGEVGVLRNHVVGGKSELAWLSREDARSLDHVV